MEDTGEGYMCASSEQMEIYTEEEYAMRFQYIPLVSQCLFQTSFSNRTLYLILAYKLLKSCSCWHSDNRWCFEVESILLQRRGIRLKLLDEWTWTVWMCTCPLCDKTTFISSNRYPVILDDWRDVTWSPVRNAILVLAKRKWENMTICFLVIITGPCSHLFAELCFRKSYTSNLPYKGKTQQHICSKLFVQRVF